MPLVFLILSSILNVGLDILFISQFHMGIQGAAYATVIAQGVSAILCILYIVVKVPLLVPTKSDFTFHRSMYAELVSQGLSMGVMMAFVSTGTVILQKSINGLGYLTIAAHTTARKINAFCLMPCGTVSAAVATFVSQNKGADQPKRIKKGIKAGILIVCGWGVLATILMLLFSKPLAAMISGSQETEIIANASRYLQMNAPFYAVVGILFILRHSLQGLGEKLVPLISSVVEFLGKIAFAFFFIPMLGYFGVIICEPLIWCIMCAILLFFFLRNPYLKTT